MNGVGRIKSGSLKWAEQISDFLCDIFPREQPVDKGKKIKEAWKLLIIEKENIISLLFCVILSIISTGCLAHMPWVTLICGRIWKVGATELIFSPVSPSRPWAVAGEGPAVNILNNLFSIRGFFQGPGIIYGAVGVPPARQQLRAKACKIGSRFHKILLDCQTCKYTHSKFIC